MSKWLTRLLLMLMGGLAVMCFLSGCVTNQTTGKRVYWCNLTTWAEKCPTPEPPMLFPVFDFKFK